jgi:nicotinamide mononucleotide adenylyltransferase
MSIDYLIPDLVVSYIFENNLYRDLDMPDSKGKENAITNGPDAGTSTG